MKIRLFKQEDAIEVAQLVAETLKVSNSKDYSSEYINDNIISHSAEALIERAKEGHMYVVCDKARIVGCGAIAGYWGSTTESILLTIFVLPAYQGKGIGSQIIHTLEQDEFFLRAKRIEIPASITASAPATAASAFSSILTTAAMCSTAPPAMRCSPGCPGMKRLPL